MAQAPSETSATVDLRQTLARLSAEERQRLEKSLWAVLQARGTSPHHAICQARGRLPKIVEVSSPPPEVLKRIAPTTWDGVRQLHHQAASGVRHLQQSPNARSAGTQAPTSVPSLPTQVRGQPAHARKGWYRSRWFWFILLGVVLPAGWGIASVWTARNARLILSETSQRQAQIRSEAAAAQGAIEQLRLGVEGLRRQAQAAETAQAEGATVQSQINESRRRSADLKNRLQGLQTAQDQLQQFRPKVQLYQEQVSQLDRENRELRETLFDAALSQAVLEISGALQRKKIALGNGVSMDFVLIPAGTFMMGSPASEAHRDPDEGPQHRVRISKGFWMGVYEVTQSQYQAVMGMNQSHFKGSGDLAMEEVSWYDAVDFCRTLSQKEGKSYRLLTEAEWEYACRAGTTAPFSFGQTISTGVANYDGNYGYWDRSKGQLRNKTVSVGSFQPNAFGLYDMHGNMWEWCSDWYGADYYATSPSVDPSGPSDGDSRVLRGGGWTGSAWHCRSASRFSLTPDYRNDNFGFRVVLDFP